MQHFNSNPALAAGQHPNPNNPSNNPQQNVGGSAGNSVGLVPMQTMQGGFPPAGYDAGSAIFNTPNVQGINYGWDWAPPSAAANSGLQNPSQYYNAPPPFQQQFGLNQAHQNTPPLSNQQQATSSSTNLVEASNIQWELDLEWVGRFRTEITPNGMKFLNEIYPDFVVVGRLAVAFGTLKEADVDMEWVERFPREITPDRLFLLNEIHPDTVDFLADACGTMKDSRKKKKEEHERIELLYSNLHSRTTSSLSNLTSVRGRQSYKNTSSHPYTRPRGGSSQGRGRVGSQESRNSNQMDLDHSHYSSNVSIASSAQGQQQKDADLRLIGHFEALSTGEERKAKLKELISADPEYAGTTYKSLRDRLKQAQNGQNFPLKCDFRGGSSSANVSVVDDHQQQMGKENNAEGEEDDAEE